MSSKSHITAADFAYRFPLLIQGRHLLPRKRVELWMLLLSTVLTVDWGRIYSESEINEHLSQWISRFGTDLSIDHVTLRRYLVDESILSRDPFGTHYTLNEVIPGFSFDASIRSLNLGELVIQSQQERAARKKKHGVKLKEE